MVTQKDGTQGMTSYNRVSVLLSLHRCTAGLGLRMSL